MEKLRDDLNNSFDIRSYHQNVIDWISEEFGVEVGEDEDLLHEDNCIPIDGKCPRKRICSGVDHVWLRDAMERQAALEKKDEYAERKVARIKNDQEALKKMKASTSNKSNESAETDDSESVGIQRQDSNEYFQVSSKVEPSQVVKILSKIDKPSTRSGKEGDSSQAKSFFPSEACQELFERYRQ